MSLPSPTTTSIPTSTLQLYADFSGGIDISRGVAQIFGIDMIDNFKRPYATMLVYFLFPAKKYKWTVLLAASVFFYAVAGYKYAFFILFTTLSTYLIALWISRVSDHSKKLLKEKKKEWDREQKKRYKNRVKVQKRLIMTLALLINFGILAFLKYYGFFAGSLNDLLGSFKVSFSLPTLKLFLPLGISFYTFQSMGYIVDVYREKTEAQRNPFKLLLFVSFFPQIIQGPISIYDQLAKQLFEPHDFNFTRMRHGMELILWGFFKKLVIADRAYILIGAVEKDYAQYGGTTLTFTILLYALQLYADFSGGIDISRGVAQIFGIDMIDNFKRPYLSRRDVERVHQRGQEDEGHPLRQNRRGRAYRQGAPHQRRLADRIPRGRRLARRGLEIRRVRRLERRDHHGEHSPAAAL